MKHYKLTKAGSIVLSVLSMAGVVATAIISAKNTLKVKDILDKGTVGTPKEQFLQVYVPNYLPTVITGAATILCIAGNGLLNKRTQTGLVSAYALVDRSYKRYQGKVKQIFGMEAHDRIMQELAVESAQRQYITATGGFANSSIDFDENDTEEKMIFYDSYSRRHFESTINRVLQAQYHVNRNFALGAFVSVNDFYSFLGVSPIDGGDDVGWTMADEIYWIDFDNHRIHLDKYNCDCLVIDYVFDPMPNEYWEELNY